ncbi:DUF6397 family protein [Streptomyces sp. NBC_01089]|uniref:DUF6397 family protein n=1 Tax=Streptomyces sp. NBC_01089 TaxID=2903747 RepID=UPI003870659D|nr:DUF6397 family protein [Streptomyces sp. NBC_01089]
MAVTEADRGRGTAAAGDAGRALTFGRAAQELDLKRGEFELAVQLGLVRVTADAVDARRRIAREEIDRLRAAEGFPDALRGRVRTVGTAAAAELIGISQARFTRLARAGCFTPVSFHLNRYRAVVWMYLAAEVEKFAEDQPALLTGRTPEPLRGRLGAGEDWRARNWRGRRQALLLRRADGAWARAAVLAGALDPVQFAEVVDDPYERAYLNRLRPDPVAVRPDSPAAREVVERLLAPDDPDEILWCRTSLILALEEARASQEAPRPGDDARPAAAVAAGARPVAGVASGAAAGVARPEGGGRAWALLAKWRRREPGRSSGPADGHPAD